MKKILTYFEYILLLFILILWADCYVLGQNNNLHKNKYKVQTNEMQIDTLSLVPNSVKIVNTATKEVIDSTYYKINYIKSTLLLKNKIQVDSITVHYRTLPIQLDERLAHKKQESLDKYGNYPLLEYQPTKPPTLFEDMDALNYQGSFSRGISVGNTQDLSVNSSFNLQLNGKLNNDVEVLASITDNNIPFQTQGNTQQLQEFDKIFIQLNKNNHKLILGDYEITRPKSYFMNFYKKLQGIQYSNTVQNNSVQWQNTASAAIARGRYTRMSFQGEEGNQGPYKLIGADGETFIIVLSGSERVYIDGNLLTRGSNHDYVIDYNLGEVFFTPNQLITKDKRIVIEFEYSQRYFLRSLVHYQSNFSTGQLNVNLNLYSEQDAKNQAGLQELDGNQKTFLKNLGDDVDNAFQLGITNTGYVADRILYRKIDTLLNGQPDSIFVYSTNPETAVYSLSFANVGLGNGHYQLTQTTANGRVYEWVAPDAVTGQLLGSFEPIIKLIAPQAKQLATLGVDYQLTEKTNVSTELALSRLDPNTFSQIGDFDDKGVAVKVGLEDKRFLSKKKTWETNFTGSYEWVQDRFERLEAYRPVEFARNWNIAPASSESFQEHLTMVQLSLQKKLATKWGYGISLFNQEGNYNGVRHQIDGLFNKNGYKFLVNATLLNSESTINTSRFFRPTFSLSKQFKKLNNWRVGFDAFQEDNRIYSIDSANLSQSSFSFYETLYYIQTPTTSKNRLKISYGQRYDFAPQNDEFVNTTIADNIKMEGALAKNPRNQLLWNITYRTLRVDTTIEKNINPEKTLLGQWTYNFVIKNGLIRSSTDYQIGSGQQQRVEYLYTPVAAQLGDFIWVDHNQNGLQDNNEFEMATDNNLEDSIRFVRIVVPSNEFQRTNQVKVNQSFSLNPKAIWFKTTGWQKWAGKLSAQSTFQINRQYVGVNNFAQYNPFYRADSSLVTSNNSIRNILYFNKGNSTFNMDYFFNKFSTQTLLINGTDGSFKEEYGTKLRWGLGSNWNIQGEYLQGFLQNKSEAFEDRDYLIDSWQFKPKLTFQQGVKFRCSLEYLEKHSEENTLSTASKLAIQRNLTTSLRWSTVRQSTLNAKFSFITIQYEDDDGVDYSTNTPAAFQILQGLQPGQNFRWTINYETRLINNILLGITYDGKKSEELPVSHVGKVNLRAVF